MTDTASTNTEEAIGRDRRPDETSEIMLAVDNVFLSFGGVKALQDVSFDIRKGEIRAIIGPNGAGKSSMLNVINGFYKPNEGSVRSGPRRCLADVPEYRAVPRHVDPRQYHDWPQYADAQKLPLAGDLFWTRS